MICLYHNNYYYYVITGTFADYMTINRSLGTVDNETYQCANWQYHCSSTSWSDRMQETF